MIRMRMKQQVKIITVVMLLPFTYAFTCLYTCYCYVDSRFHHLTLHKANKYTESDSRPGKLHSLDNGEILEQEISFWFPNETRNALSNAELNCGHQLCRRFLQVMMNVYFCSHFSMKNMRTQTNADK